MIYQGYGKILNVTSVAAFQVGPLMAVYFATKTYIVSFSEMIANEIDSTGVIVTTLCPEPTGS
jgi:short-subunit dehydrogenase